MPTTTGSMDVNHMKDMDIFSKYAILNGYSPMVSHPSLGHVDGPGMPTYDEYLKSIETEVADAEAKGFFG